MLKVWLKKFQNNVIDGSRHLWNCYGNDYVMSFESWKRGKFSTSIIFNPLTQEVFEVTVYNDVEDIEYRWIKKKYRKAVKQEYKKRGFSFKNDINGKPIVTLSKKEMKAFIKSL